MFARSSQPRELTTTTIETLKLCPQVEYPQATRILAGTIEKRLLSHDGHIWKTKRAILTSEELVLINPTRELAVTDIVPLCEIQWLELTEEDSDDVGPCLHIRTEKDGLNAGTHFVLHVRGTTGEVSQKSWFEELKRLVPQAQIRNLEQQIAEKEGKRSLAIARFRVKRVYDAPLSQTTVCAVVLLGFIIDMTEAMFLPERATLLANAYIYCDIAFTAFFRFHP